MEQLVDKAILLKDIMEEVSILSGQGYKIFKNEDKVYLEFKPSLKSESKKDIAVIEAFYDTFYQLKPSDITDIALIYNRQEFNSLLINYFLENENSQDYEKLDGMIKVFESEPKTKRVFCQSFAIIWDAFVSDTMAHQPDIENDLNSLLRGDHVPKEIGIISDMLNESFREACSYIAEQNISR